MRISLLSAAVNGDNSGDAMIEEGLRRILVADAFERFPLLSPLTADHIALINRTECAVICGTNLYQQVFACTLNSDTIRRIKVPIIPIGIGSSAAIGQVPRMKWLHARVVRRLHSRCPKGSVRDPASLKFIQSIGVKNAVLTGCPVLFHGLTPPNFDGSGKGMTLSIRARLLHVTGNLLGDEQSALEALCRRYTPVLVAQSPYDLEIGRELCGKYGLEMIHDPAWQGSVYEGQARRQRLACGFRLHYGMISLSYGKPAYFIAHDSRAASFCDMMGIPFFDIEGFSLERLCAAIDAGAFDGVAFRKRWCEMAAAMNEFLRENGLTSRITTA